MNERLTSAHDSVDYRLDEIDRHTIYALMADARNKSAPTIAEEENVSPGTIRNRIDRLEELGIITGYHAHIDFERVDGRLTNLFICNAPVENRETVAKRVRSVPGVIKVRELMSGRMNLHVLTVGENTADLRRISRALAEIGIDIQDEVLVQNESFQPYAPFGPEDDQRRSPSDFISLAGDAEVVEVTVRSDAPLAGKTLEEAGRRDFLNDETLVVSIERDGDIITPRGRTEIGADDVVTVFSRGGVDEATIDAFLGEDCSSDSSPG